MGRRRGQLTYASAVDRFLKSADWLDDKGVDAPAVTSLQAIAAELDEGKAQAALIGQFNLIYRSLMKRGEVRGGESDEDAVDDLLGAARAS